MGKHLIDIDEEALLAARAELGARTMKETVNLALRLAAAGRADRVSHALDILGGTELVDRTKAWR